jgi:hypothetical protein
VAQLGSAAALGAVGRRFKSYRPDHFRFGAGNSNHIVITGGHQTMMQQFTAAVWVEDEQFVASALMCQPGHYNFVSGRSLQRPGGLTTVEIRASEN